MAVGVKMHRAIAMPVAVEVHAVAPQPPQHMRAEADQHDADRRLDRLCDGVGDRPAEQNGSTGEYEQGQRVTKPPGQPVLDDIADVGAARGNAGHRGDVIGLERMLHAQKKPETQNSEHTPPACSRRIVARGTSHRLRVRTTPKSETSGFRWLSAAATHIPLTRNTRKPGTRTSKRA